MNEFADLCNSTRRASFVITHNVKTRKWKITLGSFKHFIDKDLGTALELATDFIKSNTEKTKGVTQLKNYAHKIQLD